MLKTIILRFRDLVTTPGQTIELHKEICNQKECVYWGWWNKPGETIPDSAFRQLNKLAEAGTLNVFLCDSGRSLLFRAKCQEIIWNNSHKKKASPEKDSTPLYYRDQEHLVWFKLSEIDTGPINEKDLHDYSYCSVKEFFSGELSNYDKFYGKQVHSIKELIQQNRTIWFLKEFIDGEHTHEISLLANQEINPSHFTDKFIQTKSNNLLWVSDLHFCKEHYHSFPLTSKDNDQKKHLGFRITNILNTQRKNIGGVIASGDLTWRATDEEYDLVKEFLGQIASWGSLDNYQFLVCPGNHDFVFTKLEEGQSAPGIVGKASSESTKSYESFYEDLFYIKPNKYFSLGRKFLLSGAIPVEVACINSNYLEQYQGEFQGHGYIGMDQLNDLTEQMGWNCADESNLVPFRIVVMHHHILPVTYTERASIEARYSITLDAEAFQRWAVKNKVKLVMHGHMHQPFFTKISRTSSIHTNDWHDFFVVGLGSTGVTASHIGEIGKNTFGLLTFNKNSMVVKVQEIDPLIEESKEVFSIEIPY